ncbi:MAG: hypothetical protein KatS3mg068_2162 [Candidatus Sericytochromatia bacterium]|nr:MAG: hypothetical protein KatS3mg068_2162 [Candidatus Sericytochromatia bacterium]
MSGDFNFAIQGLLPANTKTKNLDPVGDDIVKITEEFAKLLIAQIQNQDPDNPPDMTEITTQYSQMLATLGQIKANNALIQFGQIAVGTDVVGKTIEYTKGTTIQNGQVVDILESGVVTSVDFRTDEPRVFLEGKTESVAVKDIRHIHKSDKFSTAQTAAQMVGKTVSYIKMVPNPAYIDEFTTPSEPPEIPQEFTGIVTSVNLSSATPKFDISGETEAIPINQVTKIHN